MSSENEKAERLEDLRRSLLQDPSSGSLDSGAILENKLELISLLLEDAGLLEEASIRAEARELCFSVLKEDAAQHRARLFLARLFYLDGMSEFCIRELVQLKHKVGELSELERLLESFGDLAKPFLLAGVADEEELVIAEMDMDKLV